MKNLKIELKCTAKSTGQCGHMATTAGQIFNFDGFNIEVTQEQEKFLRTLGQEFVRVPESLMDSTTAQNFIYEVRLV